jgi:3-oxoadipate enol-lactonase
MAFLEANGVSFHYRLEGASHPQGTVVFLHEIGGSLESWDNVVPDLARRRRVFRYDQRGFGLSEKIRAPYTVETLVDDLDALIAALKLEAPFHLVSLAASSMQALSFYRRHPGKTGSLVFCNPAPGVDPSRADALNAVAAKAEADGIRAIIPAMLDKSYPPELSDRATYEAYRGRYMANDPVGFGHAFRMMAKTNLLSLLETVACPTLVIAGSKDFIRAVPVTEGIAKKIPGARFEIIEAGHFMPTTSPGPLLACLQDFWK